MQLCSGCVETLGSAPWDLTYGVIKSEGLPLSHPSPSLSFLSSLTMALCHILAPSLTLGLSPFGKQADGAVLLSGTRLSPNAGLISGLSESSSGSCTANNRLYGSSRAKYWSLRQLKLKERSVQPQSCDTWSPLCTDIWTFDWRQKERESILLIKGTDGQIGKMVFPLSWWRCHICLVDT